MDKSGGWNEVTTASRICPALDWHGAATLATWLMTLFIQRAEHRDTQAIQAKLDELLKANRDTENHITRVDEKGPEEIEGIPRGAERGIWEKGR